MDEKKGDGWKWVAGGLALIVTYQLGYESGSKSAVSPPAAVAAFASDEPLMGNVATWATDPVIADAASSLSVGPPAETEANTMGGLAAAVDDPPEAPTSERPSNYRSDPVLAATDEVETVGDYGVDSVDTLAVSPSTASATETTPASQRASLASKPPAYGCAENGSCYGDISAATGRPKTVSVRGYYRKDGTYVRGHYRSRPR